MPVRFLHKRRSKISYCNEPVYLDCETSWNHDVDNPICWIVSIQVLFDGHYHLFRKPEELMQWYSEKIDQMNLHDNRRLITYIHNASYDLSYLAPYIQEYLPGKETRFGIYDGANKIITYNQGALEFKCTYLLSGVSLAKWSKDMSIEHPKKIGLYDYEKILYQDSELSEDEQEYDRLDVIAMEECFQKQLKFHNDTITTIPLTSTGYSRRLLRNSCDNSVYRQEYFLDNRIDLHTLLMDKHSYAGGYTHNNRHLKSKVITGLIGHRDFRSHYPTQIRCGLLPWGKTDLYYNVKEHEEYKSFHGHYINITDILKLSPEYTTISKIRFFDMYLKDPSISMPFMQESKIWNSHRCVIDKEGNEIVTEKGARLMCDNGRVLALVRNEDECGYFDTYLDNYTLQIIQEQYNVRYIVLEVLRTKNKPCPKEVAEVIDKLFADKSNLKIIHQRCIKEYGEFDERTLEAAANLLQSKKLLNAIYGVFAYYPLRQDMDFDTEHINDEGKLEPFFRISEKTDNELLDDYYSKFQSFIHYPIGCAVTARARFELYQFQKVIGFDKVLYCDTDSIYYIKDEETEKRIEALNAVNHKTVPYITNIDGKNIYYDVFEEEEDLIAFKGLHSKCYGYVTKRNELKAVIAGVPERTVIGLDKNKKPIYLTREEELAGITKNMRLKDPERKKYKIEDPIDALDKLEDDFKFKINSGVTAKYIHQLPHIEMINGHEISTAGGCIIQRLDEKLIHDWDFLDDVKVEFSDMDISM